MLTDDIIEDLQSINWEKIVSVNVEDCNDRSWRFVKGKVVEYAIDKHKGNTDLIYVDDIHKDFVWPSKNLTVEVKSQLSSEIYKKNGKFRKSCDIKINNSNGTNNKTLQPSDIADIIIVVKRDGAFCIDKETVLAKAKKTGDGFNVIVTEDDVVEITGKLNVPLREGGLKEMLENVLRERV